MLASHTHADVRSAHYETKLLRILSASFVCPGLHLTASLQYMATETNKSCTPTHSLGLTPVCVSCEGLLEIEDAKPLLKVLKQREFRWPVLGDALGSSGKWEESQFDLLQTLAQIRTQHSKSVLLRFYVSPDDKNSNKYIIKVSRLTVHH